MNNREFNRRFKMLSENGWFGNIEENESKIYVERKLKKLLLKFGGKNVRRKIINDKKLNSVPTGNR